MKCKWGLTGFYLTNQDGVRDHWLQKSYFNVYQHIIAWGIAMLAVILLRNIGGIKYWCMVVNSPKFNLAKMCHCNNILNIPPKV